MASSADSRQLRGLGSECVKSGWLMTHTWDFLLRKLCEMVDLALVGGLFMLAMVSLQRNHCLVPPLPCQKKSHCSAWLLSSSSLNPKTSFLSANLRRYSSSAEVSMTGKGGDWVWSRRTGMRPLGSKRRNQSFFCSLVMILLKHDNC